MLCVLPCNGHLYPVHNSAVSSKLGFFLWNKSLKKLNELKLQTGRAFFASLTFQSANSNPSQTTTFLSDERTEWVSLMYTVIVYDRYFNFSELTKMSGVSTVERGSRNTADNRMFFKDSSGNIISPFHDIPMMSGSGENGKNE